MHVKGFGVEKHWKDFPIKLKHFENGQSSQRRLILSKGYGFRKLKNYWKRKGSQQFEIKNLSESQRNQRNRKEIDFIRQDSIREKWGAYARLKIVQDFDENEAKIRQSDWILYWSSEQGANRIG